MAWILGQDELLPEASRRNWRRRTRTTRESIIIGPSAPEVGAVLVRGAARLPGGRNLATMPGTRVRAPATRRQWCWVGQLSLRSRLTPFYELPSVNRESRPMLTLRGTSRRLCDGVSRRRFIQIGALSYFGLTLPDLLRAESRSPRKSKRSVILIWQHGGPSQLDTFDMKPNTPAEVRGPYKSISTTLPGLQICELMPYHAQVMDKCTVIRSFTHGNGDHWAAAHWMLTGYLGATGGDRAPRNPSMGAIMSHLLGPRQAGVPATVNINDGGFGFHGAAFLGVAHNPFRTGEYSYGNEAGRLPTGSDKSFQLVDGLSKDRLVNRLSLLQQFDRIRRDVDTSGTFDSMDAMGQQAQDMLLVRPSSRCVQPGQRGPTSS